MWSEKNVCIFFVIQISSIQLEDRPYNLKREILTEFANKTKK